ncbi:MED6-domain-containing protein [Laetiporus sulphureus 93-53]|uniref:Mediator of RNA polymerase II transcription subunit 6 n=1 Tax=Laetiporus sulphureus 93-53 TaxID=1314785 RepID=A0A165E6H1_9APHY|nr:MED6-domain-containing protein [Laetiporus sulphureus 93-53]KZT06330.1 MED6-domain-containing protein [Laetiporus sulphureus 93-53]
MDLNDLHPPDDYSHRFFIWHEWIQANGPLTNENVFDYFATSMFYDKQSNNQVLRMQTMHVGMPLENEAEELRRFTGVEFAVVHAQPPGLFIIHKRERLSPDEVRPLAAYFIINNRIYQSPDVYTLVSNRLLTSLHALQTSMDTLRAHRPSYTPRTGFVWPIVEFTSTTAGSKRSADEEGAADSDLTGPSKRRKRPHERQQNNLLLFNAMRTTAVHANASFTLPEAASESTTVPETPGAGSGTRSSGTPAPASTRGPTPKRGETPQAQPAKGPPGGGKKKKRRTGTMSTVS